MQNSKRLISILIATYNRGQNLRATLEILLGQETGLEFGYEVLTVDNNSTDRTKEIIESFSSRWEGRLKYLFEPKQGKCFALNRAIKASKGQIIAFTDDDCLPEKQWLHKIWSYFSRNPLTDGISGRVIWEDGKPWFKTNNILRGSGLNMAFRKSLFEEIGYFDTWLGPGSFGCAAEDRELVYRALKHNKKIEINNDILVVHKHRQNSQQELLANYRDAKGITIFWLKYALKKSDLFALKNVCLSVLHAILNLAKAMLKLNRYMIALKTLQLAGILVGIARGIFLWMVLEPLDSRKNTKEFS